MRFRFSALGFYFLAAILSILTACAPEGYPQGRQTPELPVYPSGTFPVDPTAGELAVFSNLGLARAENASFGIRYNSPDLEAILNASALSTIDYIKSLGVEIYRMPRPAKAKAPIFYRTLPTPPKYLNSLWKDASEDTSDFILGIYQDICDPKTCSERQTVKPIILIDEASERWTLVHEMLHFSIEQQAKKEGSFYRAKVNAQVGKLGAEIDKMTLAYDRSSNEDEKANLAKEILSQVVVFGEKLVQSVVRGQFEESAIEFLLMEKWNRGDFNYVPEAAVANAAWYLKKSIEEGSQTLDLAELILNQYDTILAEPHGLNMHKPAFKLLFKKIKRLRLESQSLVEKSNKISTRAPSLAADQLAIPSLEDSANLTTSAMLPNLQPISHEGCSREHLDHSNLIKMLENLRTIR